MGNSYLTVAGDVFDGVFLCCPFSHVMSWMISGASSSSSSWFRAGIFVKNVFSFAGQGLVMAISKPPKTMYRLKALINTIYTVELSGVVEQVSSGGGVT